ncbi:MAG: cobalamin-binding protein [Treponema sp.]|nr:cobalamin-binding protein [Treponema sp.]
MKNFLVLSACFALLFVGCSKKSAAGAGGAGTGEAADTQEIPQRIVTLSPSATEILYAIGAANQIVAVSEFSDYPPEALQQPRVGGFDGKTLSMEKILSFKPDFVYMTQGMHNFLIEQLESYGIAYYLSRGDNIQAVCQEIVEIARITGHEGEGMAIAKKIEGQCEEVYKFEKPVLLYYEVWNSPFMTAGTKSFIHDVITKAGGLNIFADLEEPYPIISEESLIARAPEVILLPVSNGITADDVKARAGWQDIPAVKNNRIYLIDDALFSRPATRIGDCVLELNELLAGSFSEE